MVSGPSGAGKGTLIQTALQALPQLAYSVSATTRSPRAGEVDGQDYIFLSREEFRKWIEEDRFLEWAEYSGNLYGTPEHRVDEFLDKGLSVILEIELQGARQVKKRRPDALMVFVRAPSLEENRRRLQHRATESLEDLEQRMNIAQHEVRARGEFDYEIVNEDLEKSSETMINLLSAITRGEPELAKGVGNAERT